MLTKKKPINYAYLVKTKNEEPAALTVADVPVPTRALRVMHAMAAKFGHSWGSVDLDAALAKNPSGLTPRQVELAYIAQHGDQDPGITHPWGTPVNDLVTDHTVRWEHTTAGKGQSWSVIATESGLNVDALISRRNGDVIKVETSIWTEDVDGKIFFPGGDFSPDVVHVKTHHRVIIFGDNLPSWEHREYFMRHVECLMSNLKTMVDSAVAAAVEWVRGAGEKSPNLTRRKSPVNWMWCMPPLPPVDTG